MSPSGGAVSTAPDYMDFLVMTLNKGVFGNKRILNATTANKSIYH